MEASEALRAIGPDALAVLERVAATSASPTTIAVLTGVEPFGVLDPEATEVTLAGAPPTGVEDLAELLPCVRAGPSATVALVSRNGAPFVESAGFCHLTLDSCLSCTFLYAQEGPIHGFMRRGTTAR